MNAAGFLYGGRMIAFGSVRQLTVMLGFALGRNAIAAFLHRRGSTTSEPPSAATPACGI